MVKKTPGKQSNQGEQTWLGRKTPCDESYNPQRLIAIPRKEKRAELGILTDQPPFSGIDLWNHYEVSWLNEKNKPVVATAAISYHCHSPCIIESKSLKLYFNSINNTSFKSLFAVQQIIEADLSAYVGDTVTVALTEVHQQHIIEQQQFSGVCLDTLDIQCHDFTVNPLLLNTTNESAEETLYTHLLKSNCLVTHQPDWASVSIEYRGNKIDRVALLRYIVSYRNHNEFHEQCIERIFSDIMRHCKPSHLTVYGRFTRRGGIDINPYRSTQQTPLILPNGRLIRQ